MGREKVRGQGREREMKTPLNMIGILEVHAEVSSFFVVFFFLLKMRQTNRCETINNQKNK